MRYGFDITIAHGCTRVHDVFPSIFDIFKTIYSAKFQIREIKT